MKQDLCNTPRALRNAKGVTLIEIMVVSAIVGITALAMATMFQNQLNSTSYLEFQLKRTQIQTAVLGQFLNDPANCACLFAGAASFPADPAKPGAVLAGVAPSQIGTYSFVTPGVCATATVPLPFATAAGLDSVKLNSVSIKNILRVAPNSYAANFSLNLSSVKKTLGPSSLSINVPVNVVTTGGGAYVNFKSCSTRSSSTSAVVAPIYMSCSNSPSVGAYKTMTQAWPNATYCAPAACPTGYTDHGLSCQAVDNNKYNATGNCQRVCLPDGVSVSYTLLCPFFKNTQGPPDTSFCAPNSCLAGDTDLGLSGCFSAVITNSYGGENQGYCKRECKSP